MFRGNLDTLLFDEYMLLRAKFWALARILDHPMLGYNDPLSQNGYTPFKALASATNYIALFSKIPKHKVTWAKGSILVVPIVIFAWWEDLTSPLTLSWWRLLSYRNQSIDLQSKSIDRFLYDNGLRHEKVKSFKEQYTSWRY